MQEMQMVNNNRIEKETERLKERFKEFIRSLGAVMNDITALEVNTMVVAQITGNKFIAEEAYQYIYEIPASEMDDKYFVERKIPAALYPRYRNLRKKLLWEYRQVLQDPIANIFDTQERLPNPADPNDQRRLQELLDNGKFLRGLRKIIELKAALDSSDMQSETMDIIYAQTVMQLDGDIINRYHEDLLAHDFRQTIISIHSQGVSSGEQQWRGILEFMVNIVQAIIQRGTGSDLTLFRRTGGDSPPYRPTDLPPYRPTDLPPSDFSARPGEYGR